ncbi:helix-turn-helix transcriptional regulator [Streptomyces sp. NPDC020742]|uniref:helix-turn-helix domain-containing protein n=1 Tax=Streptomyces sp. NPDC020742 TaxID=3154897 RepID=UPI0033E3E38A
MLARLALGHRNRAIAQELHISESTVKFHVAKILTKLGVGSRGEAAALFHTVAWRGLGPASPRPPRPGSGEVLSVLHVPRLGDAAEPRGLPGRGRTHRPFRTGPPFLGIVDRCHIGPVDVEHRPQRRRFARRTYRHGDLVQRVPQLVVGLLGDAAGSGVRRLVLVHREGEVPQPVPVVLRDLVVDGPVDLLLRPVDLRQRVLHRPTEVRRAMPPRVVLPLRGEPLLLAGRPPGEALQPELLALLAALAQDGGVALEERVEGLPGPVDQQGIDQHRPDLGIACRRMGVVEDQLLVVGVVESGEVTCVHQSASKPVVGFCTHGDCWE